MELKAKGITLRLVEENDAEFILSLRLDKELAKFLSKTEGNIQKQIDWIREYKKREKEGLEYYFIAEDNNHYPYGTIRLYNFKGDNFTYGSWLFKQNTPAFFSIKADFLCRDFAFYTLKFKTCLFDVRKANKQVLHYHKMFNCLTIGEDELNYYFELPLENYKINKEKLIKLLNFEM